MSSSGKGQSTVNGPEQVEAAWNYAVSGGRVNQGRVIVEGFIPFDYEITQLTVRAIGAHGEVETHIANPSVMCRLMVITWKAGSPTSCLPSRCSELGTFPGLSGIDSVCESHPHSAPGK